MKIIIESKHQAAYVKFKITENKISDLFDVSGKIGAIQLKIKSSSIKNVMKIKIGETILTNKELIDMNCPYQPDGQILFNQPLYIKHAIGKTFIEFKKGDVFEFEQMFDGVSEINIWFFELQN